MLEQFPGVLTQADHRFRMERQLFKENWGAAQSARRRGPARITRRWSRRAWASSATPRRPAGSSPRCRRRCGRTAPILLARAVAQRRNNKLAEAADGDRRGHPRPGAPRRRRRVVGRAPPHRPQAARQRRRRSRLRGRQPPWRRDRRNSRSRPSSMPAGSPCASSTIRRSRPTHLRAAARVAATPISTRPRRLLARARRRGGRGRGGRAAPLRARRRLSDHLLRPARPGKARQRACPARGARPPARAAATPSRAHRGAGAAPALRPRRARPRAGAVHRSRRSA